MQTELDRLQAENKQLKSDLWRERKRAEALIEEVKKLNQKDSTNDQER